ncbi:unnamed protein product [Spirodela intermedia]|uniref:Uncharacterized protein n=1 Tax=Spirodela intermedia TaxID=51605 RepID=A0A7I8IAG5_SPIIN|nr:unnamed protein product [Spirodela intermedia]CAA6654665.1 unnamed protein product [Spirodela intermedia]
MGRRVVSSGCHSAEQKNGDFVALRRLSPTERSWMEEVATRLPADRPLPDDGFPFLARVRPLLAPQLAGHR